jgi:hypothetical protein
VRRAVVVVPANVNGGWVGGGFGCRWRGCAEFVGIIAVNAAHPPPRQLAPSPHCAVAVPTPAHAAQRPWHDHLGGIVIAAVGVLLGHA